MQDEIVNSSRKHMQNRLFVFGNGFDLEHNLPTRFCPDFKEVAIRYESNKFFWDIYQSEEPDIWSDFEKLLAKPDFDSIREIFDGFSPDYASDHESDRDSIITQVTINGNLTKSLNEFAINAENELSWINPIEFFQKLLSRESYYLSFNYTHTLEQVYQIPTDRVLHIHGEVGGNNELILGYDVSDFDTGEITEDISGQDRLIPTTAYINGIEDYYIRTAYDNLLKKVQSWAKPIQKEKLMSFMNGITIDEVIVIGFSFGKVDAAYFELIQNIYPNCRFLITAYNEKEFDRYEDNIKDNYTIKSFDIKLLKDLEIEI